MKKKSIFISICIGIILILLATTISIEDSEIIRSQQEHQVCWLGVRQIGRALCQYAMEHDNAFPPDLQTLIQEKYLNSPDILQCNNKQYHYIPGLRLDMPCNLPILIERHGEHIYNIQQKPQRGGFVLKLDFVAYSILQKDMNYILQNMDKALQILPETNKEKILQTIESWNTHEYVLSLSLWKLRQLNIPILDPRVQKQLRHYSFGVRHQAALLLANWDKKSTLPVLQEAMMNTNYAIRKSVFSYFSHDNPYYVFSHTLSGKMAYSQK